MSKLLNKGISTPIGILVIVLAAVIAGGSILAYQYWLTQEETEIPQNQPTDETANWQTYSDPKIDFTFKYPNNWEIKDDYFYETAAGIKSEQRTVILQKTGNEDSNDWVRINERQFQCQNGKCEEVNDNTIATYSKDQEVLNIFDKIVDSFQIAQVDENADWEVYKSPDSLLYAQIVPIGKTQESKIQIRTNEDTLLEEVDYSSEDGDHGLIIARAEWTPDSQFFIYSAFSSGGHQPWFSRVYFYNRSDNKIYNFREASGFTVANDEFTVVTPDIVTFTVYTSPGMGTTTIKAFELSEIISTLNWETYKNEEYNYEVKYPSNWQDFGELFGGFNITSPTIEGRADNRILILAYEREGTESNEEYINNMIEKTQFSEAPQNSFKEIIVNGIKGYEITLYTAKAHYQSYEGIDRFKKEPPSVYLETPADNKARFIIFVFQGNGSQYEENLQIFYEMLSTFKFLE